MKLRKVSQPKVGPILSQQYFFTNLIEIMIHKYLNSNENQDDYKYDELYSLSAGMDEWMIL